MGVKREGCLFGPMKLFEREESNRPNQFESEVCSLP